jgi:regulator of nucleoside diphosphate kinase
MSYLDPSLPPIIITTTDAQRLSLLVNGRSSRVPPAVDFLMREIERADIVPPDRPLRGLVRMGSRVTYRDGDGVREVMLVYPQDADIERKRISILTPVGAALIGLSVGQSIEYETPNGEKRSLAVMRVAD